MYLNTNNCVVMQFFTDESAMSSEVIAYVRHSGSTYFLNFYNSMIADE